MKKKKLLWIIPVLLILLTVAVYYPGSVNEIELVAVTSGNFDMAPILEHFSTEQRPDIRKPLIPKSLSVPEFDKLYAFVSDERDLPSYRVTLCGNKECVGVNGYAVARFNREKAGTLPDISWAESVTVGDITAHYTPRRCYNEEGYEYCDLPQIIWRDGDFVVKVQIQGATKEQLIDMIQ